MALSAWLLTFLGTTSRVLHLVVLAVRLVQPPRSRTNRNRATPETWGEHEPTYRADPRGTLLWIAGSVMHTSAVLDAAELDTRCRGDAGPPSTGPRG